MLTDTKFIDNVFDVRTYPYEIIKRSRNSKLGRKVNKGRWRGMPIYTVTLPERRTCPAYCEQWEICYGNNMPFAHRIDPLPDPDLFIERVQEEVAALSYKHRRTGFVVRLHVLGDFFSVEYVEAWYDLFNKYNNLKIYGYTHHIVLSDIGGALWGIRNKDFNIRFSDSPWFDNSANATKTDNSITCPEQTGHVKSCGDCALCWTAKKPIHWITH